MSKVGKDSASINTSDGSLFNVTKMSQLERRGSDEFLDFQYTVQKKSRGRKGSRGKNTFESQKGSLNNINQEYEKLLKTEITKGLTNAEALIRLERLVLTVRFVSKSYSSINLLEIPDAQSGAFMKFIGHFAGPISYLIESAIIITALLGAWIDFGILVAVLLVDGYLGFQEAKKAESAVEALNNTLAIKSRCYRDGALVEILSSELVPGDIAILRLGDIVPADIRLLGCGVNGEITDNPLLIDQSNLTGESFLVSKARDDTAYSSSIVKQGTMLGVVVKTGVSTYIGRAANLISVTNDEGEFQEIISVIGNFLVLMTSLVAIIIFVTQRYVHRIDALISLKQVVSVTIAAIPVGLTTVMSTIMAVGAKELAKKKVVIKNMSAIEELAFVSILCCDKTGTLTMNKLVADKNPYLRNKGNTSSNLKGTGIAYTEEEMMLFAYLASEPGTIDAIEGCVRQTAEAMVDIIKNRSKVTDPIKGYQIKKFIPFDNSVKYTEALVYDVKARLDRRIIKGAPQVIVKMCGGDTKAEKVIEEYAYRGLRTLGVAMTVDEELEKFELIGMISLMDPPRPDSGKTIKECSELGIKVKMITGDQLAIAKEVAYRMGMDRVILDADQLMNTTIPAKELRSRIVRSDGFAQVTPEQKFKVVDSLQTSGYTVGMTGDGVNDAPALKKANVGIAVEGCSDAARSASDIVLLADGLSTIIDGVKCSREIFQRMRSYALYRISSTFHFLIFFVISILWFHFSLSDTLTILVAVLNDFATLVISADNACISSRPDKWRVGQLFFLSFVLGFIQMLVSFAHFEYARYVFPFEVPSGGFHHNGPETEDYHNFKIVQTIMFLQISTCPHFVILSTRVSTWWWKAMPSMTFLLAILGTQVISAVISLIGPSWLEAVPIGPSWTFGVLGSSFISFLMLDAVKVLIFNIWNFKFVVKLWPSKSNKEKLAIKEKETEKVIRVSGIKKKVKKVFSAIRAKNAWEFLVKSKTTKI